jgi:hypothetical protein
MQLSLIENMYISHTFQLNCSKRRLSATTLQPTISLEMPVPSQGHYSFFRNACTNIVITLIHLISNINQELMMCKSIFFLILTFLFVLPPWWCLLDKSLISVITILQNQSTTGKLKTVMTTKSVNNRKTVKTVMTLTWYTHF